MIRRVLHLVESTPCTGPPDRPRHATSDQPLLACAAALNALPDTRHTVCLLGTPAGAAHAAALGLRADLALAPPLGEPALAWRAIRRAVRDLGPFDSLQPWSDGAQRACVFAGAPRRIIATPPDGACPALPPPAGPSRPQARESLGVSASMPMVGLLADPPWLADARRFVYMIGLLDVAGIPVAGVVDPRTAHLARARRFHAEAAVAWKLLVPRTPLTSLLHACDLAVVVPPAPHREPTPCERAWTRWSVTRAHALGVPVIAAGEWLAGSPARPEQDAGDGAVTEIARLLARMAEDPGARASLADDLRADALQAVSASPFVREVEARWSGPPLPALTAPTGPG